ncbi:MAG: RidA family protein [Nitriliruptorales bacterium]|nr:RidA family protein [Nitriliruptorales bacterium]
MTTPEQHLAELGIELPSPPAPAAAYVPVRRTGNLVFTAGQVAAGPDGPVAEGIVGREVDLDTAVQCARQCAVNVLAQLKVALGELAHVEQVVKLTVFVASTPDFTQQHVVANGASELIGEVFGDAGRHARSAVGTPSLPTNSPVEVEAIVQVR